MTGLLLSPALHGIDSASFLTVPLHGVEAQIYNDIGNAVIDRKLRAGTKLEELVLSEIYGVSRTVIRKVLVLMEQDGIISLPLNRGAYVASPTREEAEQVVDACSVLYQHFARKLASHPASLSPQDVERVEAHLKAEDLANEEHEEHNARRLRTEFATVLGFLSGNPILTGAMAKYMVRLIMVISRYQQYAVLSRVALSRTIWEFIRQGEPDKAAETIQSYGQALVRSLRAGSNEETNDLRAILMAGGTTREPPRRK